MNFWIRVRKLVGCLAKENKKAHKYIENFNPDVMSLEKSYQDFSTKMQLFNAGSGYENFNDFIVSEASEYKNIGDGVTYVVWNVLYDKDNTEIERDIVSYYTLSATAIPYEDRIRCDEEEALETGEEFDIEICGISALEIKMFAVNQNYQDVFFEYAGEDLPISAWIMRNIIDYAYSLLDDVVGFRHCFYTLCQKQKAFIRLTDLIL